MSQLAATTASASSASASTTRHSTPNSNSIMTSLLAFTLPFTSSHASAVHQETKRCKSPFNNISQRFKYTSSAFIQRHPVYPSNASSTLGNHFLTLRSVLIIKRSRNFHAPIACKDSDQHEIDERTNLTKLEVKDEDGNTVVVPIPPKKLPDLDTLFQNKNIKVDRSWMIYYEKGNPCVVCLGQGTEKCLHCYGKGTVNIGPEVGRDTVQCPVCDGAKTTVCMRCEGTGKRPNFCEDDKGNMYKNYTNEEVRNNRGYYDPIKEGHVADIPYQTGTSQYSKDKKNKE